jgi:CRP-like cAMP-binding protein
MVGLEVLRKSDVFGGLTDEELYAVAKMSHEEVFEAGTEICAENDAARNLYVVIEGRVVVMVEIGRGRQAIVDTVTKGGSFGWSAIVPPYVLTGSAKAVDRVRLVVISGDDIRNLCRINCAMCYAIMEKLATIISRRLTETRLQLISLMYH